MGLPRRFGSAFVAGFVVASVTVCRVAHASPQDLFGFGAHSSAMGAAGPASAEGYEAVFGSPALLAEAREKELTLGLAFDAPSLHADSPGVPRTVGVETMSIATIGAVLPIPLGGALADRITLGVGFLDPTQSLIRAEILYPERFQYPIVGPRVQTLAVMVGGGIKIGDRVFVGIGAQALAALVGSIDITIDSTGHVGSKSDEQVVAAYAPVASIAVDATDNLRFGLTFRGQLAAPFSVTVTANDLGIALPAFNVAGLAQFDPAQLGAEVRWSSAGNAPYAASRAGWRLVAGALYRGWSNYRGEEEPTVLANNQYATCPHDPVAATSTAAIVCQIGAKDTLSLRLGVERAQPIGHAVGLRIRAGYMFEPTPLPKQTSSFPLPADPDATPTNSSANELDATRHVLTAGLGVVFGDHLPVHLDMFAQLHILVPRDNVKDGTVPSDAPGYPSVRAWGTILVAGASAGVQF